MFPNVIIVKPLLTSKNTARMILNSEHYNYFTFCFMTYFVLRDKNIVLFSTFNSVILQNISKPRLPKKKKSTFFSNPAHISSHYFVIILIVLSITIRTVNL